MDILSPLIQLIFRALVVVLPLTIGWLAFRRLMLSRSSNAWIYALTCMFAAVTAAALMPWTLGIGTANWIFFLFSAAAPVVWFGVIVICDPLRQSNYDREGVIEIAEERVASRAERPLVLEHPNWPEAPVPVFRHAANPANLPVAPKPVKEVEKGPKSLLSVARGMRGNATSEARRPRMLPAPELGEGDLPFLKRG